MKPSEADDVTGAGRTSLSVGANPHAESETNVMTVRQAFVDCTIAKLDRLNRRIRLVANDSFYHGSDLRDMIQTDARFAGQFDKVGPDSFRVRQAIPHALRIMTEQMNRHIAALNLETGATKR